MKNLEVFENFNPGDKPQRIKFTDSEISYYEKIWKTMTHRYTENKFFSNIWKTMKNKKSLTKNQWIELEFLFKNGKSRYESGQFPSNY